MWTAVSYLNDPSRQEIATPEKKETITIFNSKYLTLFNEKGFGTVKLSKHVRKIFI